MLLEELEKASRQAHQKRVRFLLISVGCAAIVALFLLGIVTIDLSRLGLGPEQAANTAPPASSSSEQVSGPAPQETDPAVARAERPKAETAPVPQASSAEDEATAADRAEFKEALKSFESDLEAEVASEAFAQWNAARQREILDKKDRAVSEFTKGNYGAALSSLQDAASVARNEIGKRDAAFDSALAGAKSSYEADDYDAASLGIAEALRLKPGSLEAGELAQAIDGLPPLLALIEKAEIARTENNLEAEKTHLEAALGLDPSRQYLATRLEKVTLELRERAFTRHIDQGMAALGRQDLKSAYKSLEKAREIFKGRPEAKLLSKQAAELSRKLEFERLMAKAHRSSQSDDWRSAGALFREAGDLFPGNAEANAGMALATQVVTVTAQLSKHLQAPQRLTSGNVARQAQGAITEARPLANHSRSLKAQAEKLSALLEAYSTKVQVRVVSDGKTNISVRGVGKVGRTENKTIELKPGQHTFEGVRQGFRAKLIDVQIPPGAVDFVVEIYCDERI